MIIIEAELQVHVCLLSHYQRTGARLVVHRKPGCLGEPDQQQICQKALDYEGRWYGFLKIAMQALDHAIGDRYLFRRLALTDSYPICSWLVGYVYDRVLGLKFGMEPNAAAPNDILDYCVANGWECVWADSQTTLDDYLKTFRLRQAAQLRASARRHVPGN